MNEALRSLLDVIRETDLSIISFCKSNVAEYTWLEVKQRLRRFLSDINIKIIVCSNHVTIPPSSKRNDIIRENHESLIGGHKGISKTFNRIRQKYHWPHLKRDVENFVNSCRNCQLKKLIRIKPKEPMILTDTPDSAFDKISMDIMGPLPKSQSNNQYILTIQDLLTKYSLAIPLREASAICVADALVNDFICIYGAPKALLTDQGTHFLNVLMKNVAKKFKISHCHTTAYRPQANGSVERSATITCYGNI